MKKKGLIIGNCQTSEMANMLNMGCRDLEFEAVQVHLIGKTNIDLLQEQCELYSTVLSFPLSDNFGALSRSAITKSFPMVKFITNIHFEGLHPDFTFIGSIFDRCVGPLGNYHSRIAFHAFMAGKSTTETAGLFNAKVYDKLGYADLYSRSEKIFRSRDSENDINFANDFFYLVNTQRALLTFNHPTTITFVRYVRIISDFLRSQNLCETAQLPTDAAIYENSLVSGPALPVYPELAEQLGLAVTDDYIFKTAPSQSRLSSFIDLSAFIEEEFACFSSLSLEWLESTPQWAERQRFLGLF